MKSYGDRNKVLENLGCSARGGKWKKGREENTLSHICLPGPWKAVDASRSQGKRWWRGNKVKVLLFLWCGQISEVSSKDVPREARP